MKASVILAHPQRGSLNHALAAAAVRGLEAAGYDVTAHDLYAEGFDPLLRPEEVETTTFSDPLAARHASEVLEVARIVVVHPTWFFHVPAMAKGWVDRVIREGIAFDVVEGGVAGHLRASSALIVTTANASRTVKVEALNDPLTTFWRECVFAPAGVGIVERIAIGPVRGSTQQARQAWLAQVERAAGARRPP